MLCDKEELERSYKLVFEKMMLIEDIYEISKSDVWKFLD